MPDRCPTCSGRIGQASIHWRPSAMGGPEECLDPCHPHREEVEADIKTALLHLEQEQERAELYWALTIDLRNALRVARDALAATARYFEGQMPPAGFPLASAVKPALDQVGKTLEEHESAEDPVDQGEERDDG